MYVEDRDQEVCVELQISHFIRVEVACKEERVRIGNGEEIEKTYSRPMTTCNDEI